MVFCSKCDIHVPCQMNMLGNKWSRRSHSDRWYLPARY